MDPVTHTFTGALLSETGLRKLTPLATATLVVAANVPDVDIVAYLAGEYAGLAHRRGWTHGLPAVAVWPFVVAGVVLAWDRLVRRRRRPGAPRARAGPLLALALLGVLTHPSLDWLNTYGMRWLMPLDGRWFYGDAVFIVDPWLWLFLGGPLFLARSRSRWGKLGWALFGGAATFLMISAPGLPAWTGVVWIACLAGLLALRLRGAGGLPVMARGSGCVALGYVTLMVVLSVVGGRRVASAAEARGLEIREVMVAPEPADPLSWSFLVTTPDAYHRGALAWTAGGRPAFDAPPLPRVRGGPAGTERAIEAASRAPAARDFLVWSRYPFYRVETAGPGFVVRIGDARYAEVAGAGGLAGLSVRLDARLRVAEPDGTP